MKENVINFWNGLQIRERWILALGFLFVATLLFYILIWKPWHSAIFEMDRTVQAMRQDLVWMKQQVGSDALQNAQQQNDQSQQQGSILSLVEQSAKKHKLSSSIKQMVPSNENQEIAVVLEDADFNRWLQWVDELYRQHAIKVKQVAAERDDDRPNIADIRMSFYRS